MPCPSNSSHSPPSAVLPHVLIAAIAPIAPMGPVDNNRLADEVSCISLLCVLACIQLRAIDSKSTGSGEC